MLIWGYIEETQMDNHNIFLVESLNGTAWVMFVDRSWKCECESFFNNFILKRYLGLMPWIWWNQVQKLSKIVPRYFTIFEVVMVSARSWAIYNVCRSLLKLILNWRILSHLIVTSGRFCPPFTGVSFLLGTVWIRKSRHLQIMSLKLVEELLRDNHW